MFGGQRQNPTSFSQRFGKVRAAVIRKIPATRDTFTAKPGHSSDQKADNGGLLLIGQDIDIGKTRRIVDGEMYIIISRITEGDKPPLTFDPGGH